MKLLFLLGFIFLCNFTYSQDKDPLHLFDSTQKTSLEDSIYHDVKDALSAMATGLKTTSGHVYSVLVYQQRLNAIIWLIIALAGIFPVLLFTRTLKKPKTDPYDVLNTNGVMAILMGSICLIWAAAVICHVDTIIVGLFNPEYGALKDIMDFVKQ